MRGPMLDLISYDRKYGEVATYLLGDVLVVQDLERALALWRETKTNKTIVTLEGEVIDPHGVGHRRLAGVGAGGRARAEAGDPRARGGDGAARRGRRVVPLRATSRRSRQRGGSGRAPATSWGL